MSLMHVGDNTTAPSPEGFPTPDRVPMARPTPALWGTWHPSQGGRSQWGSPTAGYAEPCFLPGSQHSSGWVSEGSFTWGLGDSAPHCSATLRSTSLLSCSDAQNLRCLGTVPGGILWCCAEFRLRGWVDQTV